MKAIRALCVAAAAFVALALAANAQIPRDPTPVVAKTSPADIAAGKVRYEAICSRCHGLDGGGSDGPSLQAAPYRLGDAEVGNIIRSGIPGTEMNGFGMRGSARSRPRVVSFFPEATKAISSRSTP